MFISNDCLASNLQPVSNPVNDYNSELQVLLVGYIWANKLPAQHKRSERYSHYHAMISRTISQVVQSPSSDPNVSISNCSLPKTGNCSFSFKSQVMYVLDEPLSKNTGTFSISWGVFGFEVRARAV